MPIMARPCIAGILCLLLSSRAWAQSGEAIFTFVDPLIGTANGGHVFAGATLPFGMAKAVPDSVNDGQGGFSTTGGGPITGFSHMHDSGTGGANSLGNFPLFPYAGCQDDEIDQCDFPIDDREIGIKNSSIEAHPGYFAIEMMSNVRAEMTVTNHTALYRFTFPDTPDAKNASLSPLILQDLIDLPRTRINGSANVDPDSGRMSGTGLFNPSFGIGSYYLHFCTDFKGANIRDNGVFMNNRAGTEPKNITAVEDSTNVSPAILPAGSWMRFEAPENNEILARVGVSFMSVDQACSNAESEIPDFDFDAVHEAARQAWIDTLGVFSVTPGQNINSSFQTIFWSGVYRAGISPQDYTGENYLWDSDVPYYDSFYCIWDSFRSIHSLITIMAPEQQIDMMRSLIDIYEHEGWLPDCRMSLCKGHTQGGSNADVILVDQFVKMRQISEERGLDWQKVYEAIVKDAEEEPPSWDVEGRGGLHSWKNLHYIPTDDYDPYGVGPFTRSISRTVEYAYNDFCIAEMAAAMGNQADAEKYYERSGYWRNMFKEDQVSRNYTGFLMPKFLNGTWGFQDPIFCSPLLNFTSCYLNPDGHETYEGSSWMYSFFVPHDHSTLIPTLGGADTFVRRLDYLHESGLLYIGDEQAFLPVFQHHYAGRPAKSAERVHYYIPREFNTSFNGLAGNDDSGAMGSFLALSMMGSFPNPGQNVYLITPPFFEEVNVTNKITGNTATIRNINFDPTYKNIYIQSATMNGKTYTKNWFDHSFYLEGGVLELTLGAEESEWGTRAEDVPPSLSEGMEMGGYSMW